MKVGDLWDMVRAVISEHKPAGVPDDFIALHNLRWALESDKAQLWLWLPDYPEKGTIGGFAITSVQASIFGVRDLVVHFIYTYLNMTRDVVIETLDSFQKFSDSCGCRGVLGYAKDKRLVDVLEGVGDMEIVAYIVGRFKNKEVSNGI